MRSRPRRRSRLLVEVVEAEGARACLSGCSMRPLEAPYVERGPSGFWAIAVPDADGTNKLFALVAWHGREVTVLADVESLHFAP